MRQEGDLPHLHLFEKKFPNKDILYSVHRGGFIHFHDSSGIGF